MSIPVVKHNTFVGRKHVDIISKVFIILTFFFGVNRIGIIENVINHWLYLSFAYSFFVTSTVASCGLFIYFQVEDYLLLIDITKYVIISLLVFALRGRLQRFYKELDQFDEKIGFNVEITKNSIENLIQMSFMLAISTFFVWVYPKHFKMDLYYILIIFSPLTLSPCFELCYMSHLIGMLSPRIRLVSYHINLSYPVDDYSCTVFCDDRFRKFKKQMKRKPRIQMGDLMDLYYSLVKAYDYLNDAIKWQLLILLTATFVMSMGVSYKLANSFITGNFVIEESLENISFIFLVVLPIFSMCFFADQVSREVNHLRETLTSGVYENNLDKSTRTAGQAFIGLTEARNLTFALFNMFQIDITLPFKFLSLLLTYLIILLQFQKVVTPSITA